MELFVKMASHDPVTDRYNGPKIAGICLPARHRSWLARPIAAGPVHRPFVILNTLDTGQVVREFNESDDVGAKCRVRQLPT